MEFMPNPTSGMASNSKISEIFNNITSMAQSGNIDGITSMLGGVSSMGRGIHMPVGMEMPTMPPMPSMPMNPMPMDATMAPMAPVMMN